MVESFLSAAARGDAPSDVLFRGGRLVNVFTGEVERADLAVLGGTIVGVGPGYEARQTVDLDGAYLAPGLIDAHVHIESSLVTPAEFARAVVPRGTTSVVADPHEIANVHGLEGIRYMLDASEGLPLSVFMMASSCVPATPMSTAGAALDAEALESLRDHPRVLGLAEVMNFPGVIHGDPAVRAKIDAYRDGPIDGHAPGVSGAALNAYVLGGPGSDHECTTPEEALEKLRRGLFVFFREATNAKNLEALLPALTEGTSHRVALCTDDRQPPDLLDEGGIDSMIRRVIDAGTDPVRAIRLATLNPAEYFGLRDRGALAPGRRADLLVLDDLDSLEIRGVWAGGSLVACDGVALDWEAPPSAQPPPPTLRVEPREESFRIEVAGTRLRVIEVVPDQLLTRQRVERPMVRDDAVVSDPERDLLKIAVMERHTGSGRVGLGLVAGMGLTRGAIAGTVAHDHHNLIIVGVDDTSMTTAARAVVEVGGGLAVAAGGSVLACLPLTVGGLMSTASIEEVRTGLDEVVSAARALGTPLHDPFMAMSFLGLEVIPELKITDRGLVDVNAFAPVPLWL
jgi:adenine deaminase